MGATAAPMPAPPPVSRALRLTGLGIVVLATVAELIRAFALLDDRDEWPWYAGLAGLYLVLFAVLVLHPPRRPWVGHAVLVFECFIVLALLALQPELDFMNALLVPLAFAAALLFSGRVAWGWVALLAALNAGSLMLFLGPLRGLALGLVTVAVLVVFGAYVVVAREIEAAGRQSEAMLEELRATHARLEEYSTQAGELAAVDERERVARDLNDSVARGIAGILESAREARAVLAGAGAAVGAGAPAEDVAARLVALQAGTQEALAQMRGLIVELRPKAE